MADCRYVLYPLKLSKNQNFGLKTNVFDFVIKILIFYFEIYRVNPSCSDPGRREKINLNFYFQTYLWCLKIFYDKGLHKTF